ncbi:hypothetical protein BU16DRAFT_524295 [Lophium mytilinum]|uniref:Vacuolar import and degradation protein 21 n=1 Tax=Lophium mytilinum TaxID=390894 RepID=A0A6A6R5V2_9PEZI|nr:hypothetical protein BU16DRAFT_524295 [Lophium mytilinum]
MSLDELRDATARAKKNEITSCELSRKRKLRELYAYTTLLSPQHRPQPALDFDFDFFDHEPNENELHYLDQNDISKGRHFRDSTLLSPYENAKLSPKSINLSVPKPADALASPASPANYLQVAAGERPKRVSASPPRHQPASTPEPLTANDAMPKRNQKSSTKASKSTQAALNSAAPEEDADATKSVTSKPDEPTHDNDDNQASTVSEEPSVDPKKAMPKTADDIANLPDSALPNHDAEAPPRPPQVVHLPPKEAQEKRLEETTRALEKTAERERKDDERLGLPHAGDLASSPSSTMGQSTATPRPNQRSPDTSPEEETFPDGISQIAGGLTERNPKGLQVNTGRDATPDTPDAQTQLEREQAIREMRDSTKENGVSGTVGVHSLAESLIEHAEAVVDDVQASEGLQQADISQQHSLPTPSTTIADHLESSQSKPDLIPAEPQRTPSKQTTPPADVEMEDAPGPVTKDTQSTVRSPPARMVTRVSSGAMRQKSVSEILGETPHASGTLTPRSGPVTPSRPRPAVSRRKSRASTIVIAKPDVARPSSAVQSLNEDYAALRGASQDDTKDYLQGLFSYQAHHPPRSTPLQELLQSARKTVTTSNTLATLRECQDYKILKRVYQLQNANRWSLRQLQRCREPPRLTGHIDHVLAEMKWMSTDFREERKWKLSISATIAEWCADFVNSSPEERKAKQIRARRPPHPQGNEEDMADAPTPDLMSSGPNETENESLPDDDELFARFGSNPPSGLFALGFNDVMIKMDRTPYWEETLRQLPAYEPTLESDFNDASAALISEPSILPVSRLVTSKMKSLVNGPPRKRSRYDYDQEDEPPSRPLSRSQTTTEHSMPSTPGRRFNRNDLDPEMTDVALFNPENKHVRDRIQAGHAFRPPSEFAMPSTSFFESRASSQWLWEEDQKLRNFVKDYTFNWSLIASCMAMPSMFTSGPERRTPWECFERWVQLEGLPAEMSKTQYFRTYQSRLEAAQRTVSAQQQALQQQLQQQAQSAGQPLSSQVRRRTTQPIRVERRKNNRYLAIIDGMRKLARKRESAAHKQQESAKAAQLRKAHEPVAPKTSVHTPQEFSRLHYERNEKTRERQEIYRQQMQRQAAAAQRQPQAPGQPNPANGVGQPQRNSTPNGTHIPSPLSTTTAQSQTPNPNIRTGSHPGQPVMQGNFPNGSMPGIPMGAPSIPQAPMQANMQNRQGMPPPDSVRLAMQRSQFPNTNQHQFQLQQQQINMASNLAGGMNGGNGIPNQAMMASMGGQGMNGSPNISMNGMQTSAGSPRMGQVNPAGYQNSSRPLSSGHLPVLNQYIQQVRTQHPDWSPEQVQKQATHMVQKTVQAARNSAMSAATGSASAMGSALPTGNGFMPNVNGNGGVGVAGSPSPNSAQYHTQMARQMMNQRPQAQGQGQMGQGGSGSPQLGNGRPPSRSASATPGTAGVQSPGMKQAQVARN